MAHSELADTVAYCGLVCGLCKGAQEGCEGCRKGGGDAECHQRACCLERGIEGCWLCEDLPCDSGFFADEAWRGLCIGLVQCIRERGMEQFVSLVEARLEKVVDYGEYRHKTEQEVLAMLRGAGE